MPAPSRVLLAVAHGGTGGMQVQVGLLARGLASAGCEVTVAAGPGPLDVGDAELVALPALTATSGPRVARALRAAVRRTGAQVLHAHGLRLAPVLALAAARTSLVTCHGIDPARVRRAAALVRLARAHVASCGEGPHRLLAAAGVRTRVLANAVPPMPAQVTRDELAARFGLDPATMLAVSPARLAPQKDPLTLVRAVALAHGVSCVLLGGGPLEAEVRDEVARLGVGDRVVLAGFRDDARSLLGGADALALASVWEGQPTVLLEAMSCGVAIAATACTGTVDTVVDGVTGLLAPVGDPAALGAALSTLAGDSVLRAGLAAAASARVADHAIGVVAAQHLAAYRRLLAGTWP